MPTPNEPPTPSTQETQETPPEPKKHSAEARIGYLYGQNKDLTAQLSQATEANNELRSQLTDLQEQVRAIRAGSVSSGVTGLDPVVTPSSGGENDALLRELKELKTAVGSITQREKQQQALSVLHDQQLQSFAAAKAEFDALSDPSSELSKTADKIWRNDPFLRNHVHGPFMAAHLANSFIGPRVSDNQQIEKKLAATQLPTAPSGPSGTSDAATQLKAMEDRKAELDELTQANAPKAAQAYTEAQKLRVKIAQLKQDMAARK